MSFGIDQMETLKRDGYTLKGDPIDNEKRIKMDGICFKIYYY